LSSCETRPRSFSQMGLNIDYFYYNFDEFLLVFFDFPIFIKLVLILIILE
jgi:hypothetical protein